jgi:hypothetical protein
MHQHQQHHHQQQLLRPQQNHRPEVRYVYALEFMRRRIEYAIFDNRSKNIDNY